MNDRVLLSLVITAAIENIKPTAFHFGFLSRGFLITCPTESTDYLATSNAAEASVLQQLGQYEEICASSIGPYATDFFCYTSGETEFQARMGPFILYTLPTPPPVGFASVLHMGPRVPVYRCAGSSHFVSNDVHCEGAANEGLLGYASAKPHTGMPRLLRRCTRSSDKVWYHTTDTECVGQDVGVTLGYVM